LILKQFVIIPFNPEDLAKGFRPACRHTYRTVFLWIEFLRKQDVLSQIKHSTQNVSSKLQQRYVRCSGRFNVRVSSGMRNTPRALCWVRPRGNGDHTRRMSPRNSKSESLASP